MSGNAKNLRILFFGDITGRQGRTAVKSFIANLKEKPDFVIANIENASHGFGLTKKIMKIYQLQELIVLLQVITSGIRKIFMITLTTLRNWYGRLTIRMVQEVPGLEFLI